MSIKESKNHCGIELKYGDRVMGFERHEARDLHKDLSAIIAKWDAEKDQKPTEGKVT